MLSFTIAGSRTHLSPIRPPTNVESNIFEVAGGTNATVSGVMDVEETFSAIRDKFGFTVASRRNRRSSSFAIKNHHRWKIQYNCIFETVCIRNRKKLKGSSQHLKIVILFWERHGFSLGKRNSAFVDLKKNGMCHLSQLPVVLLHQDGVNFNCGGAESRCSHKVEGRVTIIDLSKN